MKPAVIPTAIQEKSMTTIETKLTVEQLADAFAELCSSEQAEFFGRVQQAMEAKGYWAESQWGYMCGHLEKEEWLVSIDRALADKGKDALMSMAAPLYLHTLNYIEGRA